MEEKKFREYKARTRHGEAVFLFRIENEYCTYYEDANVLISVIGVDKFNYTMLDTYLPKLIRAGHRVVICEQPI